MPVFLGWSMCDMTSYYTDFYAWTIEQADRLKTQQWQNLDIENLVEEIESLGRQERQQLTHRFGILLGHLLKWQYQPSYRSHSWQATIREQRRRILRLLEENPSLQPFLPEILELSYEGSIPFLRVAGGKPQPPAKTRKSVLVLLPPPPPPPTRKNGEECADFAGAKHPQNQRFK
jgi:hypothetical protein